MMGSFMETLFKLSSLVVLPFWALMIFLPRWSATKRLMSTPLACAAVYALLALPLFLWAMAGRPLVSL
jgi:hypothetical protein